MRALLNDLLIALESEDPQILAAWRSLFDLEVGAAGAVSGATPRIAIQATVAGALPPSPELPPAYILHRPPGQRPLQYFDHPEGGILELVRPAQIRFDFTQASAHILLTPQILDTGNLEDVTMIALAPLLRRQNLFMEHAFSASVGETAVLLAGPSGSGKTTLGLALLHAGWGYLGNDVALLRLTDGAVRAFPAPGAINLDRDSLALLPGFRDRLPADGQDDSPGKQNVARSALLQESELGHSAAVKAVLFPALVDRASSSLREVKRAVGLARLLAESVDQWDRDTYAPHLDLLTLLSSQARFFDLELSVGRPDLLRSPAELVADVLAG